MSQANFSKLEFFAGQCDLTGQCQRPAEQGESSSAVASLQQDPEKKILTNSTKFFKNSYLFGKGKEPKLLKINKMVRFVLETDML